MLDSVLRVTLPFLTAYVPEVNNIIETRDFKFYNSATNHKKDESTRLAFRSLILVKISSIIVMQEASDALSKLQTVTLLRHIRSLQCSW